ncbi:MAG: class B sortase [Eggerthellaceae bacterium]
MADASGSDAASDGAPTVDWEFWLSVNPDIVAWVSVPGTDIDYPVVQASADDPTFYLDHDVYRGWNPYGCPYLDAGCAGRGIDSPLALMFGHHMNDGSMFSAFANYSDRGFAQEHQEILLQTPERDIRLNVIAADVVDSNAEHKRLEFADDGELGFWLERLLAEADVVLDVDVEADSVKAFCTCSYGRWNGHEDDSVCAGGGGVMQSTICFFIGMAMMACAIVGYACIRVGAMSEREEMLAEGKREP